MRCIAAIDRWSEVNLRTPIVLHHNSLASKKRKKRKKRKIAEMQRIAGTEHRTPCPPCQPLSILLATISHHLVHAHPRLVDRARCRRSSRRLGRCFWLGRNGFALGSRRFRITACRGKHIGDRHFRAIDLGGVLFFSGRLFSFRSSRFATAAAQGGQHIRRRFFRRRFFLRCRCPPGGPSQAARVFSRHRLWAFWPRPF